MLISLLVLTGCSELDGTASLDHNLAKGVASCSVTLVGPIEGLTASGPPQFVWDTDCDGSVIELSADGAFDTATTLRFGALTTSTFQHTPDRWQAVIDMMAGSASWRVVSGQGADTIASETRTVSLPRVGTPLDASVGSCGVSQLDPADGAFLDPTLAPTFRWSDDCDGKVLQLSTTADFDLADTLQFGALDRDGLTLTDEIWTAMADRFVDRGYWRVLAGTTADDVLSDVRAFTTTDNTVPPVASDGPVLWFVDQLSAQEGTPLTIGGTALGSDGTVWFGSVPATEVYEWSDDRIVVTVPAGAGSPVGVDVDGATSNELDFETHTGDVLWVDANAGSSGNGSESSPYRSLEEAVDAADPGDTLLLMEGTYSEEESGVGYYLRGSNSGSEGAPITIRAFPGENVVIDTSGIGKGFYISASHIVLSGLEVAFTESSGVAVNGDYVRIVDNYIHDSVSSGITASTNASHCSFVGNRVRDNGTSSLNHGLYVSGQYMHIAFNEVWDNFGFGLHVYDSSSDPFVDPVVESNVSYNNGSSGILISSGAQGAIVRNNLSYGNANFGIDLRYSPRDTTIIHNTVYDNDDDEIFIKTADGVVLWNNVIGGGGVMLDLRVEATNVSSGNNIWDTDSFRFENSSSSFSELQSLGFEAGSVVDDPEFVDAGSLDFRLAATSPGIDAADSDYDTSLDLTGRVRDAAPDVGAYELLD